MKQKRFLSFVMALVMLVSLHMSSLTTFAWETEGGENVPSTTMICTCEALCVEGEVDTSCPVCGAEDADLSACTGTEEEPVECVCETLCVEGEVNTSCPVCGAEDADPSACTGTKEEPKKCVCEALCVEGEVNTSCPVCGAEDADLSACTGTKEEPVECVCEALCVDGEINTDCPICSMDLNQCKVPPAANTMENITTYSNNVVSYIGKDGEQETLNLDDTGNVRVFENDYKLEGWSLGSKPWYVISGKCSTLKYYGYAVNRDEVNILLLDDSTLDIGTFGPYNGRANVTLNIYAQSKGDNAGKIILDKGIIGDNNFTVNIYGGQIYSNKILANKINICGGKIRNNVETTLPTNARYSVIGTDEEDLSVDLIRITGWADVDFNGTIGAIDAFAGDYHTVKKIIIGDINGSDDALSVNVIGRLLNSPGIGGCDGANIGTIEINNGTVHAKGYEGTPGIGVGEINGNFARPYGSLEDIIIRGGNITAIGGDMEEHHSGGPGIGSTCIPFKNIIISGGTINAIGGDRSPGIGSGRNNFGPANNSICTGKNIIISGGNITATGGEGAPGIGICQQTTLDSIEISGGTVKATGGTSAPGIGVFGEKNYIKTITISNENNKSDVTAIGDGYSAGIGGRAVGKVEIINAKITSSDGENAVQAGDVVIRGKSAEESAEESVEIHLNGTTNAIKASKVTITNEAIANLNGSIDASDSVTIDDYANVDLSSEQNAIDASNVTINNYASVDLNSKQNAIAASNVTINDHATVYLRGDQKAIYAYNNVNIGDTIMLWAHTPSENDAIAYGKLVLQNESGEDNTYLAESGSEELKADLTPFVAEGDKFTSADWSFEDPNLKLENKGNNPYLIDTKQSSVEGNWACLYKANKLYTVTYKFESETEGMALPPEVEELLPESRPVFSGESATGPELTTQTVNVPGGYWEFEKWTGETDDVMDDVTVIGTWKYYSTEFIIAPTSVTLYTGGKGYDGIVINDEGEMSTSAENGIPEPGFLLTLPDALQNINVEKDLTLQYDDGTNTYTWGFEKYGEGNHSVYRIKPIGTTEKRPVRIELTHKVDGKDVVVDSDSFIIDDYLNQELSMTIYGDSIDKGLVSFVYDGKEYDFAVGEAKLTVRATTGEEDYGMLTGEIKKDEPHITAEAGTLFTINGSDVQVDNTNGIGLLFDDIIEKNTEGKNNTQLLKERTDKELENSDVLTGEGTRSYDLKYLDLVDTNNGNVWVKAVDENGASTDITVYWPLPDGTDKNTEFELLHFKGLHREMGTNVIADLIEECTVESMDIKEVTDTHVVFNVGSGGFSPFVLVWEKTDSGSSGGGGGSSTKYYTLHYESNGGTEYDDERYKKNTVVELDKVPVRMGYTFTGWYADEELTVKITDIKMTSDKTVYAGWVKSTVPDQLNGDDHFAYVVGYPDGSVQPNGNITRAEVAAIFFRLLQPEVRDGNLSDTNVFTDVTENDWHNVSVSTMAELNIIKGRTETTFVPDAPITRAEFAAICARFDTGMTEGDSNLTDISGHWAEEEIERAVSLGWIAGYPDGTFKPNQFITRAEAVSIINRVLCRMPEEPEDLLSGMNIWPDNMDTNKWYYLAVQEATNSHTYEHKGEIHETWLTMRDDPDWSRYNNI